MVDRKKNSGESRHEDHYLRYLNDSPASSQNGLSLGMCVSGGDALGMVSVNPR